MRVPDYGRERLLSDRRISARAEPEVPPSEPLLHQQLKRLGNNLNQIARRLNARDEPIRDLLEPLLHDIRTLITLGFHHDR